MVRHHEISSAQHNAWPMTGAQWLLLEGAKLGNRTSPMNRKPGQERPRLPGARRLIPLHLLPLARAWHTVGVHKGLLE